ncbi:MAG: chemotaxis protein CheW [Desulfobacteraceae bacterium]|nr:chemotaxis protein CheW [Desulfobacteraceae bacterium]
MSVPGITQICQYLTFILDQETYAMDITQVREVLDFAKITKVPRMPNFIKGVINLRGGVVPVVDLRLKFGMPQAEKTVDTCIIIIEITIQETRTLLGIMADSVQEVMSMEPDQIEPAPKIGTRLKTEFIKGMGKKNDEFIIILDNDMVFSTDELVVLQTPDDSPIINEEIEL